MPMRDSEPVSYNAFCEREKQKRVNIAEEAD